MFLGYNPRPPAGLLLDKIQTDKMKDIKVYNIIIL